MSEGPKPVPDQDGFASRHRMTLLLLWLQIPALATVGLAKGKSMTQVAITSSILMALAVAGMLIRSRTLSSTVVSIGLLAVSTVVVDYADGAPFAHFHFLLMICAISFYRRWFPLALGVVAVSVYYFAIPGSTGDPVTEALTQSAVVVALALVLTIGWRLDTPPADSSGSTDHYRMSFEEAPIGMAILKPSGEFLEVNRSMAQILGHDQRRLTGMNLSSFVHADDQAELGGAWEEMGNSADHEAVEWMRWLPVSGRVIWGRVSLTLVPRTPEHPATVVLQLEDMTHAHDEQRRLEGLLRGKDEFVAAVSDEIREPLGMLIDLTDTAEHAHVDRAQSLPLIEARAREIATIVDDLVMSARAENSPPAIVAHQVDAEQLCRAVIGRIPGADDITLDFGANEMWADPALARQILNDLVGNAVRFGGPEISLRTISSGPDLVIQVIDNGTEVAAADRDRLFNADLRSGEPVTRPAAVGLSLTVSRHLARLMDGDVVYRRTGDGRNLFELRLPTEQISVIPRRRGTMRTTVPA